ncbi:hypothetical protein ABFS83_05G084900 [Erythranthe nasuta]
MSVGLKVTVFPFSHNVIRKNTQTFPVRIFQTMHKSAVTFRCSLHNSTILQESIERIRERITNGKVEITPSAYDTAWVAMVPEREYSGGIISQPCFPQCLDWIIENQNSDGSWGLNLGHPSLVKDSLSCTLACLLALRKWNVAHKQIHKGLEFIRKNSWAAIDKDQISPIGFNIIFPSMITYANETELTLPFDQHLIDSMFQIHDSQIKCERNYMKLGYVAEGIGEWLNWSTLILTQQRNNGSLFDSPATTAAALVHHQGNSKCFDYLQSLLDTFKKWAPTNYPLEIYTRLCLVETIQELGIDRYFEPEIDSILEETYRLWLHKEEEIFKDITCCAVAFRLLRIKGFEVSSDFLVPYTERDHISLQTTGVSTILELYRASQIRIHEDETTLDAINKWTTTFLKQQLLSETIPDKKLRKKVEYELKNFHGILGRVRNRRSLDLYDVDNYHVMKSAYRCPTVYNEEFLIFSRQDFNICQALHQKEFQRLERWYSDCGLDRLNFGRDALRMAHFIASAIFGDPQLVDARMSFAKNVVLIARIDDFFDQHGSREESYKILELVKEWNEKPSVEYGFQEVEILFTAVYRTVNELAERAYVAQGRCVKHHLINLWVEILTCFVKEFDTWCEDDVINLDEYLSFARISVGTGVCILTSMHFLGIKLSEETILSEECISLCAHVGTVNRLLNDLQSSRKEKEERRVNAVSILKEPDDEDEEMAVSKIEKLIEYNRRKLLRMVYKRETIVPRKCKDLFSEICKMGYYLYSSGGGDEFTSPQQIMEDVKSLIHQPLKLPPS